MIGRRLAHFEILSTLGEGGMGLVYKARDTRLDRLVAIKLLTPRYVADPERKRRFAQEAKAASALNHPNIITIYEITQTEGTDFIVMEYVQGKTLGELIGRKGLPLQLTLNYAIQVAAALAKAHDAGIIHRDLKPSNIMVTADGLVKILDFGVAKLTMPDAAGSREASNALTQSAASYEDLRTEAGQIVGTVAYMSPEQVQGQPVDGRSDIFSLGTLLYEVLTGSRPFRGENTITTMSAILQQDPQPPSELTATPLPRVAERLVLRCLRKDPARRFQTASDLKLALEDLNEETSSGSVEPLPAAGSRARFKWSLAVAAAGIVAVVAAAGYWFLRRPPTAPHKLQQLTFEAGIAQNPALSPDGKLLAYATDRGGDGQLDIWLKQLAGGQPVRLTQELGSKSSPQFSADGTRIYYISGRTIFEVPTLGGAVRKVFEPAGPFSVSSHGDLAFYQPGTGGAPGPLTIVPTGGGAPEPWHPECLSVGPPVWSPDGDRLMFVGGCAGPLAAFLRPIVYIAPRRAGSIQQVAGLGPNTFVSRPSWFRLRNGREGFMLPVRSGDTTNLFRMSFDGRKEQVTHGTGSETWPVVSPAGELIFSRAEETPAVWSLPLDGIGGQPEREAAPARNFGTSRDGRELVYGRMLGALRGELVLRDRATGTETILATHDVSGEGAGSFWPQVSPDGKLIVYRVLTRPAGNYLVSAEGGEPHLVVPIPAFNLVSDWFPDGTRTIGECSAGGAQPQAPLISSAICSLDPATGAVRRLLTASQDGELLYPSFSWDGEWVTFMRRRAGRTVICVTPVRGDGTPGTEADWRQISPDDADASRARFSPDGTSIYYELRRAGVLTLVKQTLEPTTKKALERPQQLALVEFSGIGQNLVSVTRDRVFFNTDQVRSNIWITSLE